MKSKALFLSVFVLLFICFDAICLAQSTTDWTMFRYDSAHTGNSSSSGPTNSIVGVCWTHRTGGVVVSSPVVVEGIVYVGSYDYNIYALNPIEDELLWSYTTGGIIQSSPAAGNGMIYVTSGDGKVYALNANSGSLQWSYTTGSYTTNNIFTSSPVVAGEIVYVGSDDNKVYALNAISGALIWSYATDGPIDSSPAVSNGIVYIGSNDHNVYALAANTGALLWSFSTGNIVSSSPTVSENTVYVGSNDNKVYALDSSTGSLVWSYTTGGYVKSSPAVSAGVVCIGSGDNNVYALNASTGAVLWYYTTGAPVYSSAAVADGFVYIGSNDGILYALNEGSSVWRILILDGSCSSPAISNGVLYIGSDDNQIYALGLITYIRPNSVSIDVGQSKNFTSYVQGGNGMPSHQWFLDGVAQDGATDSSWTYIPSEASVGTHTIYVLVTSNGEIATSDETTVTVYPTLQVSLPSNNYAMDIGQTQQFSVSFSGGAGTLHYQWYLDSHPVGADNPTYYYTATGTTHTIYCVVADSATNPVLATTNSASITVNPTPNVSISPIGPLTMDSGQIQTFSALPTGGSGTIHYQWYLDNQAVGSDNANYLYIATEISHSVICKVTDSAYTPVTSEASNTVSITVNSELNTPSVTATLPVIDWGNSSALSIENLSGGTVPYSYQWLSKAPGTSIYSTIQGATLNTYIFSTSTSTDTGLWSFELKITDSASTPMTVTSSPVSVTVSSGPKTSISPASWIMDLGKTKEFTAVPSEGTGSYSSYQWFVNGVPQTDSNSSTFAYVPTSTGNPLITVTVTDNLGTTSPQSSPSTVQVYPVFNPPADASASANVINAGQSSKLNVNVDASGGTAPFFYQWLAKAPSSNTYSPIPGATTRNYIWSSPNAATGNWDFKLQVTDAASNVVVSNTLLVTVNSALIAPSVSASPSTLSQGQTSKLISSSITTGTAPYTYQWYYGLATDSYVPIANETNASYNFATSTSTQTGNWNFLLQITDSTGAVVNSNVVTVTVNMPASTSTSSPTPSPTTMPTTAPTVPPTNSPTSSPTSSTPTATPIIPEFSWLMIIPLLLSLFTVAVLIRKKKSL